MTPRIIKRVVTKLSAELDSWIEDVRSAMSGQLLVGTHVAAQFFTVDVKTDKSGRAYVNLAAPSNIVTQPRGVFAANAYLTTTPKTPQNLPSYSWMWQNGVSISMYGLPPSKAVTVSFLVVI